MKGISPVYKILLAITIGVIIILIASYFTAIFVAQPILQEEPAEDTISSTFFDYRPYILDTTKTNEDSLVYITKNIFCEKIKNCIIRSWQTGQPCEVDHAILGSADNLDSPEGMGLAGRNKEATVAFGYYCDDEELYYEPVEGVKTHICTYSELDDRTLMRYGSQAEFSYEDCRYRGYSLDLLWGDDDIIPFDGYPIYEFYEEEHDVELGPDNVFVHFSVDNLHTNEIIEMDESEDARFSGAGRYKFVIDGTYIDPEGNCRYHLFLCPQPAIALSPGEPIIELFDIMRMLPTGHFSRTPYYVTDLSENADKMEEFQGFSVSGILLMDSEYWKYVLGKGEGDGVLDIYKDIYLDYGFEEPDLYYFSEYEIDLKDNDYHVIQLFNAVKAGFDAKGDGVHWASPYWKLYPWDSDYELESSVTPWNSEFDDLLESSDIEDRERMVVIDCGSDEICKGAIRIKIALRRDPGTYNWLTYGGGLEIKRDVIWHSIIIGIKEKD